MNLVLFSYTHGPDFGSNCTCINASSNVMLTNLLGLQVLHCTLGIIDLRSESSLVLSDLLFA